MQALIWIAIIVAVILAFWAGLLVGRKNPKIADRASELADSAKEKAEDAAEKAKGLVNNNKGHGYFGSIVWIVWIVLVFSGAAWIALSGWIVYLVRILMKQ